MGKMCLILLELIYIMVENGEKSCIFGDRVNGKYGNRDKEVYAVSG